MIKTIGATIGVIVVVAVALTIFPTLRDEVHWQWIVYKDETTSYESYVKAWPDGRHAAEGKERYDEHGWTDATAANTLQGFARYLHVHFDGKHVVEAKDRIESIHWQEAIDTNTVQGFELYLQLHADGKHAVEARDNIESLHWQEGIAAATVQGFERYLQLHADGKHVVEARDSIESLHWQEAIKGNTFRTLQLYLDKYASGKQAKEAKSRQAALLSDDAIFLQAKQAGTVDALRGFLADFPGHQRETDARLALKEVAKANVVVDFPKTVSAGGSPFLNVSGPIYKWDTTFRETGGHTGFKLRATNFHITDPSGGRWSNNWSESVEVSPGGMATVDYWCDKSDKWSGGTYYTVWVGQDDLGNEIRIVQEVRLER